MYPAGGYFGTRKACEPLHVQYSYDDHGVVVINTSQQSVAGLTVSAQAFDFNLDKLFSREAKADAGPDSSATVLTLPDFFSQSESAIYFLKLALTEVRRANRRIPRFLAGPQRKCSVCKGGAQKRRVV
jgi:exo-1,4-beta-D-glucosaminidase